VSDRAALWTGRVTLAMVVGAIGGGMLALLVSTEIPWLAGSGIFWGILFGLAFISWSVAHFVMVAHQVQAGYASRDDVSEWDAREDARLGGLIPFTYLLGSPEQRRILRYLGHSEPTRKPSHWYSKRF
jgi:hypothetical protein